MIGTIDIQASTRLDSRLARLADGTPELGREHHWEGTFTGNSGAAAGKSFRMIAHMAFHGTLIEGRGALSAGDVSLPDAQLEATLSGTLEDGTVRLEMWWSHPDTLREAFHCDGVLAVDQRVIEGSWSVACFYPDTCGCGGSGGTFRLVRVD
jgi:hypothetical protein